MPRASRKRSTLRSKDGGDPEPSGRPARFTSVAIIVVAVLFSAAIYARWSLVRREGEEHSAAAPQPANENVQELDDADMNMVASATIPILSGSANPIDDPAEDGWNSEVFSGLVSKQLNQLASIVEEGTIDDAHLSPLVAAGFRCEPLRPDDLTTVYGDGVLRVERPVDNNSLQQRVFDGPSGFVEALQELVAPIHGSSTTRCKFKVFRISPSSSDVTTQQYLSLAGPNADGVIELHATLVIRWETQLTNDIPRMVRIEVGDFEQVSYVAGKASPFFSDCTGSILQENACFRNQFLYGFNHWLNRSQDSRFNFLLGNPGLAVGDVNSDGLDDLYVCQEAGLPNRLFVQQLDGTAKDVSASASVDWLENSKCALLVDLDNDSDQDLAVAINGGVVLAANDGSGNFSIRTILDSGDDVLSLTAADFDLDGRLDLYAGVYHRGALPDDAQEQAVAVASAGVYHDANNGGPNSLFRNETVNPSQLQFTEVTRQVGLDQNNRRFTLAAGWEDIDNDGDQDLYVANDFGRNNLYRNHVGPDGQRRFVDVASHANAEDSASGMSVTFGDYDRDGWMDIYVSNMFSAAGNRVTFQQQFKQDATPEVKSRLQRFARGNTLLRNTPSGVFSDVSHEAGLTIGRWAWSSNFVDLNNDGWDDLVVANGYITTDDTQDL